MAIKKEKQEQRDEYISTIEKQREKSLSLRRSLQELEDRKRAEMIYEMRSANSISSTLRRESQDLKMLDFKENYENLSYLRKKKQDKVFYKH